jgi:hypothetical protein
MRKQGERLKHHAGGPPVGGKVVDPFAAQKDVAACGLLHAGQHAQQGCLARSGRADDGEEFTLPDIEIDAVNGGKRAENLANRFERKDSRACSHVYEMPLIKPCGSPGILMRGLPLL